MRHVPAMLMLCLLPAATGCLNPPSTLPPLHSQSLHGPGGPDVVVFDVALLERSYGDRYLNHDFWGQADEQIIPIDRRSVIEDNGFRVGVVSGPTPDGLRTLLSSERSCINPRQIQTHAGRRTLIALGPALAHCSFQIQSGASAEPRSFDQAECYLVLESKLLDDGRIHVQFTPVIQHGERSMQPRPAADRSSWVLEEERPEERYPELAWEVVLGRDDCLVVGGRYERADTLGRECFLRAEPPFPAQRALVLTARRAMATEDLPDNDEAPPRSPAVAAVVSPR